MYVLEYTKTAEDSFKKLKTTDLSAFAKLEKLRRSVAYKGHPLSKGMLTRSIGMSRKTYAKLISGVAVMQVTTCEC